MAVVVVEEELVTVSHNARDAFLPRPPSASLGSIDPRVSSCNGISTMEPLNCDSTRHGGSAPCYFPPPVICALKAQRPDSTLWTTHNPTAGTHTHAVSARRSLMVHTVRPMMLRVSAVCSLTNSGNSTFQWRLHTCTVLSAVPALVECQCVAQEGRDRRSPPA